MLNTFLQALLKAKEAMKKVFVNLTIRLRRIDQGYEFHLECAFNLVVLILLIFLLTARR